MSVEIAVTTMDGTRLTLTECVSFAGPDRSMRTRTWMLSVEERGAIEIADDDVRALAAMFVGTASVL